MNKEEKMKQIKLSFENLAQLFEVLGDQNRQHLIYTLLFWWGPNYFNHEISSHVKNNF